MRHTEFRTHRTHKGVASAPPERAHVMCSGASHGKTEEEERKNNHSSDNNNRLTLLY